MTMKEIEAAYCAGTEKWTGCDWPTAFSDMVLNLNGLRSSQALLVARATSGVERGHWHDAVNWLTGIEQEAREAEEEARLALVKSQAGMLHEALAHIQRACAIEANYHSHLVWQPLRDAIEASMPATTDSTSA